VCCSVLQYVVARCSALQCVAVPCSRHNVSTWKVCSQCTVFVLQQCVATVRCCNSVLQWIKRCNTLLQLPQQSVERCSWVTIVRVMNHSRQHTATHCHTLQHTTLHCHPHQHSTRHCHTLQHTAFHCNTLQHTAIGYSTLQHTSVKGAASILYSSHDSLSTNTLCVLQCDIVCCSGRECVMTHHDSLSTNTLCVLHCGIVCCSCSVI